VVYSVLTRTPFNPPLYPSEAWKIIEGMILPHMELVPLTPAEYRGVVRLCATDGWAGGRVHDAVHLRCAQKASCDRLYTFNIRDFRPPPVRIGKTRFVHHEVAKPSRIVYAPSGGAGIGLPAARD